MILEINDRIRVRKLNYFENFQILMKYDSLGSSFKFNFFFDPDNIEHKEMACIGHYHIAKLKEGNETLMTGFILSTVFDDSPEAQLAVVGGYSLPGVLQDCEIPIGDPASWIKTPKVYSREVMDKTWPTTWQSDSLSLKEIAQKMLNPFGLSMVIDDSVKAAMDEKYDETTAKEKQSIKSYLCELAAQKNIIITDDEFGRVVFIRPFSNQTPFYHFDRNSGIIPGTKFVLSFNGQAMHSHIRVFQQQDQDEEIPSIENQVENPYVPFVFRPHVDVQNCGDADNTLNAARNVLSKELKNLTLTIETDRWHINGKLFRPGQIISVTNKYVYLYKKANWFIEEVTLNGDAKKMTATLKCVIPEVYNGKDPEYLFKGINLH